ncbi:hypothetical protein [Acidithiobacillus ferrivorans]
MQVLADLGLVERTASGGVHCPFADVQWIYVCDRQGERAID